MSLYSYIIFCSVSLLLILSGCAKETTIKTTTVSNTTTQNTIGTDELTVNDEFEQFVDDAITVLSNHNATIPGAFVDSISPNVIEITYLGKEPDGVKVRSGADSIHFNSTPWGMPGAIATLSFKDINSSTGYEIQFYSILAPLLDSASLTFLGGATITNVSGGLLQNITTTDSLLVNLSTTNASFTFNDQAAVIQLFALNANELRSFKLSGSTILATTRGNAVMNGSSNVGTWGTNRFGDSYYSIISTPIVQNISNLNLSYNPLSGSKAIEGIPDPITTIYGLNNQGNVVTSGTAYGFSVTWLNGIASTENILPYYY